MGARGAALCLLALLVPACAGSPSLSRLRLTGWHAAQLADTRLVGDVSADEMRSLARDLARFDAIFAKLARWPAGGGASPLTVYLLRGREVALRFGLGRGVAGWALGTLDESFITVQISSGRDEDRNTLFHEYTHVLLRRNRRAPLPRWYNEGLATYFSTVSERDGAVVVGAAPGTLAARVVTRGALPLDRLFDVSIVEMPYEEVADFYATSWALSHYLLSTPAGRRELSAFVQLLERGAPSDDAQRATFGRPAARLGEELAVHVGHLARGVPIETLIDANAFEAPEPPPVVALDPGEVALALGTLALELVEVAGDEAAPRERNLARDLLAFAADRLASDARAQAALGQALAVRGDAEPGAAPGPSPALVDAEEQYRGALALDPESASAWFGLGRALVGLGRPQQALAAFETARRFGWSGPLDVALARIHLERGEREQAAALLLPIAQDPHGGRTQQEAAALLEQTRR